MTTSESKDRFFSKTNRFEYIRITNRIESIRIANWNALVWSVCLLVITVGTTKRLNQSRCCLGCGLGWAQ